MSSFKDVIWMLAVFYIRFIDTAMGYSFQTVRFSDSLEKVSQILIDKPKIKCQNMNEGKEKTMKDRTKWDYSNQLIVLMKHKPLEKITVRELCKACDARPQNFYYHFRDKYDLVTWIYAQDIVAVCEAHPNSPWSDVLKICYHNLMARRDFYRNAFQDDSTNALIHYIVAFQIDLYTDILKRKGVAVDDALLFTVTYHAYACAEITKKWLTDHTPVSPELFTQRIMDAMPDRLREPLERGGIQAERG